MIDETLWCIYFGTRKMLLIFRAGLHHRGIFILDGCPCSYSLSSSTAQFKLNITSQSIDFSVAFSFCIISNSQLFNSLSNSKGSGRFPFQLDIFMFGLYGCAQGIHLDSVMRWFIFIFLKSLRCLKFSSKVLVGTPTQWSMTQHSLLISEKMF